MFWVFEFVIIINYLMSCNKHKHVRLYLVWDFFWGNLWFSLQFFIIMGDLRRLNNIFVRIHYFNLTLKQSNVMLINTFTIWTFLWKIHIVSIILMSFKCSSPRDTLVSLLLLFLLNTLRLLGKNWVFFFSFCYALS